MQVRLMTLSKLLGSTAVCGIVLVAAPAAHAGCAYDFGSDSVVCTGSPGIDTSQDVVNQSVQQVIDNASTIPQDVLDNAVANARSDAGNGSTGSGLEPTAEQELTALYVAMFNEVPNDDNWAHLVAQRQSGKTLEQIAAELGQSPRFRSLYPGFLLSEEFADKLSSSLLGSDAGQESKDLVRQSILKDRNAGLSDTEVIAKTTTKFLSLVVQAGRADR